MREIVDHLFEMQDIKYRDFQGSLTPTIDREGVIGVRTPLLRSYAKEIYTSPLRDSFMKELPHKYFEENQLHAFLIEQIKDFDSCIQALDLFLPYVDNWATCDQMNPKCLKKDLPRLETLIYEWIASDQVYRVRFAVKLLMNFYLGEAFSVKYLELAAQIDSEEYYVNMMVAWYFATALAKQYEKTIIFLKERRLPHWTHRKTIQKACESYRITEEQKEYLRSLRY